MIADAGIPRAPGKAANAGVVAVSGLEMSQNSHRRFASAADVDADLKAIMRRIHDLLAEEGRDGGHVAYASGANIAGYRKVADAIAAMGAL